MSHDKNKGAILLEFAFAAPILVISFLVIIDYLSIMHIKNKLARFAINEGMSLSLIQSDPSLLNLGPESDFWLESDLLNDPNFNFITSNIQTGALDFDGGTQMVYSYPSNLEEQSRITTTFPALSNNDSSSLSFALIYPTWVIEVFYQYKLLFGYNDTQTIYHCLCIDSRYGVKPLS